MKIIGYVVLVSIFNVVLLYMFPVIGPYTFTIAGMQGNWVIVLIDVLLGIIWFVDNGIDSQELKS